MERDVLVSPAAEVPVIDGEVVTAVRTLFGRGVGKKAIARELGVSINTVRRYVRQPVEAGSSRDRLGCRLWRRSPGGRHSRPPAAPPPHAHDPRRELSIEAAAQGRPTGHCRATVTRGARR